MTDDIIMCEAYIIPAGMGLILKKGTWHDFPVCKAEIAAKLRSSAHRAVQPTHCHLEILQDRFWKVPEWRFWAPGLENEVLNILER